MAASCIYKVDHWQIHIVQHIYIYNSSCTWFERNKYASIGGISRNVLIDGMYGQQSLRPSLLSCIMLD